MKGSMENINIIYESKEELILDEEETNNFNKKYKTLKTSYIKERQLKEILQEELSEIKKKNELLKLELDEKEKTCVKLHREIDLLQQNLYKERTKLEKYEPNNSNSLKPVISDRRTVSMMNAQKLVFSGNEEKLDAREVFKIREENRYFKRQYEILAEKLKLNDNLVMDQRNKIDLLSMSSKRFETELKMKIDEMNITESYLQKIVDTKLELSQENERLNSEIHGLQVEKENNILKIKELNYIIDDKELKIKILEDLKVNQSDHIVKLTNENKLLTNKIISLNEKCQLFKLKKIGNLVNVDTMMVIRKNIHNSFIMELENTYSKTIIRGIDIIQISKIRNENFKFVIIFKRDNGRIEKEIFETENEEIDLIYNSLEEFKNNSKNQNFKDNQNENSGFIGDLLAFFTGN